MPFRDPEAAREWRRKYEQERRLGLRRRDSVDQAAASMDERMQAEKERVRQWCHTHRDRRAAQQRARRARLMMERAEAALGRLGQVLSPETAQPNPPPPPPAEQGDLFLSRSSPHPPNPHR